MSFIFATILTGFLGSGKTTLLKRVLGETHDQKIAVIENESGEENIDNEILVTEIQEQIVQMSNGCDATELGWGASGRNNGHVIPAFKWDPQQIIEQYGPAQGAKLVDFGGSAPSLVFDTIAKHSIECYLVRQGWIQPAYTALSVETIQCRCRQWAERKVRRLLQLKGGNHVTFFSSTRTRGPPTLAAA